MPVIEKHIFDDKSGYFVLSSRIRKKDSKQLGIILKPPLDKARFEESIFNILSVAVAKIQAQNGVIEVFLRSNADDQILVTTVSGRFTQQLIDFVCQVFEKMP